MRSNTHRSIGSLVSLGIALVLGGALLATGRAAPRFLPDDPVRADDDTIMDAGSATRDDLGSDADFVINTFRGPGDRRRIPAPNVNTLDQVPDSSWFTNRIGARPMSIDEIGRGPDRVTRLEVKQWLVVEGKDIGQQPGFRAVDPSDPTRQVYQIEFDSTSHPEMATGAEIIGTAIYHAIGYNVVDTYLIDVDPDALTIDRAATIVERGRRRTFTRQDLNAILRRAARRDSTGSRPRPHRMA